MVRARAAKLAAYLPLSYAVTYLAHVPVHHGWANPVIPAGVPWAIAAMVAIVRTIKDRSLTPAWIVLALTTAFFLSAHLLPHH